MAKSLKTPPRKKRAPSKPKAEVIDAEVVAEDLVSEPPATETPVEQATADIADPKTVDDDKPEEPAQDVGEAGTAAEAKDSSNEPVEETKASYMADTSQPSGFFPMILGGVIAGALGFGAAMLIFPDGWREKDDTLVSKVQDGLAAQQENLEGLRDQVSELGSKFEVDLGGLRDEVAERAGAVTELRDRLENLAKGDGSVALPEDVQVLLNAQKEQISSLSAEVAAMAANAKEQMAAALAQEETAEQAEARVKARGAMQQIRLAMISGEPFAESLALVEPAVDVPDGLQAVAADGVPTAAGLQQAFPEAARKALSVAVREEAGDDTTSRWQLFLKDQLGARSLTPRDGDDADAVLSRAEAAVRADDLASALNEIEALPDASLVELADWQANAQARQAALDGFEAVSDALNGN